MSDTKQPRCAVACICLFVSSMAAADHPTLGIQQEFAGSIATLSALTLPDDARTMGFELQHISNNEISDADLARYADEGEEVHSTEAIDNLSLNVAWGVSNDLTIGFNLPWVSRANIREGAHHSADVEHEASADEEPGEHAAGDVHEISRLGDSSGLGDLTTYAQYRFFGGDSARVHASTLLGLKAPTGRTDIISDEGQRFESEHQPGSGSWDVLAGLAFTRQWTGVTLDSNILYAFAGDGSQESNLGDVFNYNIALSYRLGHSKNHGDGTAHHHDVSPGSTWDISVEINGERRDYVTVAGERQTHTGGNFVYLAPSVRYGSNKGWTGYASLGVPIIDHLNGIQSDPKFRVLAGVSFGLGRKNLAH
jgi:hypothetical protein